MFGDQRSTVHFLTSLSRSQGFVFTSVVSFIHLLMSGALKHRGLEAWLEDTNGSPIALSEDANIHSNTISTWVNVSPRQVSPQPPGNNHLKVFYLSVVLYT